MIITRAVAQALLLSALPTLALGQESDVAKRLSEVEGLALEEVIVTASRREESLQEVAMSVSAFTGEFFQDAGVNGLSGLEQYTPNLKITPGADSRSTSIRIRGIGSVGTNSGIDPSVGIFIDGIYQGRAGMSISDLVDVQRVEILRGPQGTLYGKNTAAGAISVITRQPGQDFETFLEANYDSEERLELRAMINLPLGDSGHAMRLTGFGVDGDHMFENTYTGEGVNDANKWGTRARFLFDLDQGRNGDGFGELLMTFDYTKEDTDCCAIAVSEYDGLSTLNAPITNTPSAQLQEELGPNSAGRPILVYTALEDSEGFSPPQADPFGDDYWYDGDLYNKVEVGGIAAEWNKDIAGDNTLTFLNAWRHYESDSAYDGDFTAYDAVRGSTDVDLDQYSSELRITSSGGETIDYQAGLYAYYAEFDSVGVFQMMPTLTQNIAGFGPLLPNGSVNTDTNNYTTTSYAAFGQATWNQSDKLSATLGLRFTYEKKEREGSQLSDPVFPIDVPPIVGRDVFYDNSRSDSDVSPAINVRYFFEPEIMGYASVSRGFKSGGFNQRREITGSNGSFDEETATNYEIGWKSSLANRRLQFNGTLFYVDYDDFQSQTFDGSSLKVTNAGNMVSWGTELELVFIPFVDMTVGTALGYNKAEYDSFDNGQCTVDQAFFEYYIEQGATFGAPGTNADPQCTQDLEGEALDNAPEWTVSSYLQYDRAIGSGLKGVARLEHSYIDSYYLDQDLDPNLENDEVNLVNLRLSLGNNDLDWEVILWGRNLLDEEYYAFGIDIPTVGGFAGVVAPQATYGITLRHYN